MISAIELQMAEDEIKRYFRYAAEINKLKNRLNFLETEKAKIEKDIATDNIHLNVVMPGSGYDGNSVKGYGPAASQQEKALESAFSKLERQFERINNEIMDTNADIRELEYDNCDMNFILGQLDQTAREFVNLHYGKRMGYAKISFALHLSSATVSRLRLSVLADIGRYIFYMKRT